MYKTINLIHHPFFCLFWASLMLCIMAFIFGVAAAFSTQGSPDLLILFDIYFYTAMVSAAVLALLVFPGLPIIAKIEEFPPNGWGDYLKVESDADYAEVITSYEEIEASESIGLNKT